VAAQLWKGSRVEPERRAAGLNGEIGMAIREADAPDLLARVRGEIEESVAVKRAALDLCGPSIARAVEVVIETFRGGGKLVAFGNGGSAADAQHLAAELAGRYLRERPALQALALTANSSDITAIGNDYGFDRVFARLVEAHGSAGDVAVAISTSGSSPNVLAGVEMARERGLRTIGLTGRGGGTLAGMVDVPIVVPSNATPRIQEMHITVVHTICALVEETLIARGAGA
jgi:D-sedoheptulose 7-phosphate isomerase